MIKLKSLLSEVVNMAPVIDHNGEETFELLGSPSQLRKWGGDATSHSKRPLGNWQSDNAHDVMTHSGGVKVYSICNGTVSRVSGQSGRRRCGSKQKPVCAGYNITVKSSDDGNEFFYTHLQSYIVRNGQSIAKGQLIGEVGDWEDMDDKSWYPHVHIGVKTGDLTDYVYKGSGKQGTRVLLTPGNPYDSSINADDTESTTPLEYETEMSDSDLAEKLPVTIVSRRSNKNDIKLVQDALVRLGYDLGTYGPKSNGVDGDYGSATRSGVKQFQKDAFPDSQSDWDGVYGPNTARKMKEKLNPRTSKEIHW